MRFASDVQFGEEERGNKTMNGVKAFDSSVGVTRVQRFKYLQMLASIPLGSCGHADRLRRGCLGHIVRHVLLIGAS